MLIKYYLIYNTALRGAHQLSLWRNWLARSTVYREVAGSIPVRDALFPPFFTVEFGLRGPTASCKANSVRESFSNQFVDSVNMYNGFIISSSTKTLRASTKRKESKNDAVI